MTYPPLGLQYGVMNQNNTQPTVTKIVIGVVAGFAGLVLAGIILSVAIQVFSRLRHLSETNEQEDTSSEVEPAIPVVAELPYVIYNQADAVSDEGCNETAYILVFEADAQIDEVRSFIRDKLQEELLAGYDNAWIYYFVGVGAQEKPKPSGADGERFVSTGECGAGKLL